MLPFTTTTILFTLLLTIEPTLAQPLHLFGLTNLAENTTASTPFTDKSYDDTDTTDSSGTNLTNSAVGAFERKVSTGLRYLSSSGYTGYSIDIISASSPWSHQPAYTASTCTALKIRMIDPPGTQYAIAESGEGDFDDVETQPVEAGERRRWVSWTWDAEPRRWAFASAFQKVQREGVRGPFVRVELAKPVLEPGMRRQPAGQLYYHFYVPVQGGGESLAILLGAVDGRLVRPNSGTSMASDSRNTTIGTPEGSGVFF